jgi:hypothetical protein
MKNRQAIVVAFCLVMVFCWAFTECNHSYRARSLAAASTRSSGDQSGLYDADSNHLWNRLHRHFHTRVASDGEVVGDDEPDPLLWERTKYLLTGASHQRALQLLDEFLGSHGARLIADPTKRAVFQHDLWAVFDWVVSRSNDYPVEARALELRLAEVLRSIALTGDQIRHLPDNFKEAASSGTFAMRYNPERGGAFLPPDIFDPAGPWVALNSLYGPTAAAHAGTFSHSVFFVFINVPGGRQATVAYLNKLWDFPQPFVRDPLFPEDRIPVLSSELPTLPYGTQVALIRKALLIDDHGEIVPSSLTEMVQLRVYRSPRAIDYPHEPSFTGDQDFFEFRIKRRPLFARQSSALQQVTRDEKHLMTFSTQGDDVFEEEPESKTWRRGSVTMNQCASCHREPGVRSILSIPRLLRPAQFRGYFDPLAAFNTAVWSKKQRYDWGLMQGLLTPGVPARRN